MRAYRTRLGHLVGLQDARITKNRKPLSERIKDCDAQNTLIEDSIRKEYLRSEGFDSFAPPTPGEMIEFYSDRQAA